MSGKYAMIQKEVNAGIVRIESAFELARIERRHIRKGESVVVSLDTIKCGRFGLTAREAMFAYLIACSEGVHKDSPLGFSIRRKAAGKIMSISPGDIAVQCGYDAADADMLLGDSGIKQAIREYSLQQLRMNDSPAEDLRAIALSRLASSASANVESVVEYANDRTAKKMTVGDDDYYGYIPLAGGNMVRIKQLNELPDHVGMAIRSFKVRNEGTKELPILVPEIEFYDGIRAAELLLKYTGDIGNKSNSEDVAGAVKDIVNLIDNARRRNNDKKHKVLEEVNVIDTEFREDDEIEEETGSE